MVPSFIKSLILLLFVPCNLNMAGKTVLKAVLTLCLPTVPGPVQVVIHFIIRLWWLGCSGRRCPDGVGGARSIGDQLVEDKGVGAWWPGMPCDCSVGLRWGRSWKGPDCGTAPAHGGSRVKATTEEPVLAGGRAPFPAMLGHCWAAWEASGPAQKPRRLLRHSGWWLSVQAVS